jgi:hypothetical protein
MQRINKNKVHMAITPALLKETYYNSDQPTTCNSRKLAEGKVHQDLATTLGICVPLLLQRIEVSKSMPDDWMEDVSALRQMECPCPGGHRKRTHKEDSPFQWSGGRLHVVKK